MRRILFLIFGFMLSTFYVSAADSPPKEWLKTITIKHEFNIDTINLSKHPEFFYEKETYYMRGKEIFFSPQKYCTNKEAEMLENIEIKKEWDINIYLIAKYLEENIAPKWNKEVQDVVINKNEEGQIIFDGVASFGQNIDTLVSAEIIKNALLNKVYFMTLKVDKTDPIVKVEDKELRGQGIKELVSVGESDFSGSPYNRIYNINLGAKKLNAALIPKDEVFSFNSVLGEVNYKTGFKKELVIKGDRTVPDYGGGLCQVSSTAFRAGLLSGLEIVERWPHAYAVTHYTPWGTDATIYIGHKDLKMKNDTGSAILIQTHVDGNKLYFNFYGTRTEGREAVFFGPYVSNWKPALPTRNIYSEKLKPGERQKVSAAHTGFDALWFYLRRDSEDNFTKIFSRFQPRALMYLVGEVSEEE